MTEQLELVGHGAYTERMLRKVCDEILGGEKHVLVMFQSSMMARPASEILKLVAGGKGLHFGMLAPFAFNLNESVVRFLMTNISPECIEGVEGPIAFDHDLNIPNDLFSMLNRRIAMGRLRKIT